MAICSGAVPADEREDLVGDELERPARAGALEEADGALERRRGARPVDEQRPLEVRERRMRVLVEARRQASIRPSASALRSSIVGRSDSNAARPAWYGSETVDLGAAGERGSSSHSAPVRSSKP